MKTYLFIDGSNLYASQYELFGPKKFLNFSKFIDKLEKEVRVRFDQIYFYASYSTGSKKVTKAQLKNEALFYKNVKETKRTVFFKGYRSPTSGKEKEVDVKLTADLVELAFENKYQQVYLLTGDADFLQALLAISKLRIDINIVCLENRIMYRGLYNFKSFIITFDKGLSFRLVNKKKPKVICLKTSEVVL